MNEIHHYETFEIKDEKGRLILPSNLIVDEDFKSSYHIQNWDFFYLRKLSEL